MRGRRLLVALGAVLTMTMSLAACGGDSNDSSSAGSTSSSSPSAKGKVVIGSAGFTEINVMAEMYAALLKNAGYTTEIKVVQNREIYEPALEKGEIDVVPDYAATMTEFLNTKKNGPNATPVATSDKDTTVAALRQLAEPLGLTVLDAADAVDSNAFAVTKDFADKNGLKTLSDLAAKGIAVNLAATEECPTRPFCGGALKDVYKITIKKTDPLGFSSTQTKQAVKTGKDDLGLVGTTDGTLEDFGLVILTDDKKVQLADNLVPVVGKKYASDQTLADTLNKLATVLSTDDLAQLNKKVDQERQKASDVAEQYLTDKGLIS
jgi:osmoprotectant transport system substrate-binding protein